MVHNLRIHQVNTLGIFTITLAGLDADRQTDALGVVALAAILGLSLVMAGSIARPLRQVERAALEVAERRLPGMIGRLQRGEVVDSDGQAAPLIAANSSTIMPAAHLADDK